MMSRIAKLAGIAVIVLVLIGGATMMKGHKNLVVPALPGAQPAAQARVPSQTQVSKARPKRDMLDDVAAETPPGPDVIGAQQTAAPTPPASNTVEKKGKAVLELGHLANEIKLTSSQLKANEKMSLYYTCYQKNASPPLSWSDAPQGTKSFVVFLEGPDMGRGSLLQWAVYNIPQSAKGLPEDLHKEPKLENGMGQATNEIGPVGYSGPCLPKGEMTFVFSVYALDTDLNLPGGLTKDELVRAMNGHIIDMAKLPVMHYYRL